MQPCAHFHISPVFFSFSFLFSAIFLVRLATEGIKCKIGLSTCIPRYQCWHCILHWSTMLAQSPHILFSDTSVFFARSLSPLFAFVRRFVWTKLYEYVIVSCITTNKHIHSAVPKILHERSRQDRKKWKKVTYEHTTFVFIWMHKKEGELFENRTSWKWHPLTWVCKNDNIPFFSLDALCWTSFFLDVFP